MAEKEKLTLGSLKEKAQKGIASIDMNELKTKAKETSAVLVDKAGEVKEAAVNLKEDITDKLTELDRMLEASVTEYNESYTLMNDKGVQLYVERMRALDTLSMIETLINSIANRPKAFDKDFEEIKTNRQTFSDACDYADRELKEARMAATGAGAGLAAGASVAFMAPTAAMWIATTFGTASTGAAISTLSGAAATNAALAWLGGGALTAGGGGMVAGQALLALSGPIGWSIAGATLLSSIIIFTAKKAKLNKQKNEEILALKENIEAVREMDAMIDIILKKTQKTREALNDLYTKALSLYQEDYSTINEEQKLLLGALVNNSKALSVMFTETIGEEG